ncbi:DUF4255 domain-containing protein [Nocardioides taihuensis]|uniref:DUF4255 domain-containing protein n=1 Tax=Nocardioides taihuensis TaxID=1835606 RepID=A0ABW0BE51_9ACTN
MSNFLAVATVSASLQRLLTPRVSAAVGGAEVWVDRSDVKHQKSGVNIYMYKTSLDSVSRNEELPGRTSDGTTLRARPRVPVSLHYLLTFHGRDDELVPQRLLGATLAALHTHPILGTDLIAQVTAEATAQPPTHAYLALTDLADADEVVRVSPDPMSLDELSKLWSVFFQSPYQLSATYVASAVRLEESSGTPVEAPPVLQPRLTVRGLLRPTILSALNAADPRAPVASTSVLRIAGSGLRGDRTVVRVGATELTPAAADTGATSISVPLAGGAQLRAGLQPVVVAHQWLVGDAPGEPRGGETSNPVGVVVVPQVSVNVNATTLTLTSDLTIGRTQQVTVALLDRTTGATLRQVDVPPLAADTTTVALPRPSAGPGLPAGQYGVSLVVDGAQSPVTRNASGTITGPLVTVP